MVLGLDPLPHRIELAREKTRPNLSFDVGDANDLSMLAQSSFDVVVLNAVFHWLPEKTGPLRQFARVLRSRGRLGISTSLNTPTGGDDGDVARAGVRRPLPRA